MSVSKNVSCECGLNDRKRGGVVNVKHKAVKFILATEKKNDCEIILQLEKNLNCFIALTTRIRRD